MVNNILKANSDSPFNSKGTSNKVTTGQQHTKASNTDIIKRALSNASNSLHRTKNEKVLIVDGTNSYLRCFCANPTLNDHGDHFGGVTGFLLTVGYAIREINPTRVIVVFDGVGGSTRRKQINPNYKANRANVNRSKLRRFELPNEDVEDEATSLKRQYGRLVEYLMCLPVTIIVLDNIEADDAIAYMAQSIVPKKDGSTVIMSDDQDFLQLIRDDCYDEDTGFTIKTKVWRPTEKKMYTEKEVKEKFNGISSHNFIHYKAIIGDNSDNVRGISRVGPKTVAKMECLTEATALTLDDFKVWCENKKDDDEAISSAYTKIIENWDTVYEPNFRIMQLDAVDIAHQNKARLMSLFESEIPSINKTTIRTMLMSDMLYIINKFPNLDKWVQETWQNLTFYAKKG